MEIKLKTKKLNVLNICKSVDFTIFHELIFLLTSHNLSVQQAHAPMPQTNTPVHRHSQEILNLTNFSNALRLSIENTSLKTQHRKH